MTERPAIYPISSILVRNLVTLAEAYAAAANLKLTTVGSNSTSTASFYVDLQRPAKGRTEPNSCTLRKYDLLTKWFTDNWPEGHEMPKLDDPTHYQPPKEKPDVESSEEVTVKGGSEKSAGKAVGKKGGSTRGKTRVSA